MDGQSTTHPFNSDILRSWAGQGKVSKKDYAQDTPSRDVSAVIPPPPIRIRIKEWALVNNILQAYSSKGVRDVDKNLRGWQPSNNFLLAHLNYSTVVHLNIF